MAMAAPEIAIRPYAPEDAEALNAAIRESEMALIQFMAWCRPGMTVAENRQWLEAQVAAAADGAAHEFAILDAQGTYLGGVGINRIDTVNRRANLGYWVRRGATRRGIATTAARRAVDWAFASTPIMRLEIVAATGNLASQRVAEKLGATREGIARRRLWVHGEPQDAVLFALLRDVS